MIPFSEEAKCQANPFYKEYVKTKNPLLKGVYDFVNDEAEDAKKSSENLQVYRRYQLGQSVSTRSYQWVDVNDIQIASEKVFENKKLRPILGFDLALSRDFCACVLCLFDEKTEDVYLKPFLHIANIKSENRRPTQKAQFDSWHAEGYITIQNEDAISKALFVADIKTFLKSKKIIPEKTVWDRNFSVGWTEEFGSRPQLYRGTASELAHSIRFIEARSKEKKLHFIGKNPCLSWMFDNAICSVKSKGFTLLDRASRFESIDGPVACVLATKYFLEHRRQDLKNIVII